MSNIVPQHVLHGYLQTTISFRHPLYTWGQDVGPKPLYSHEDFQLIQNDVAEIGRHLFTGMTKPKNGQKTALTTSGGEATGKSTLLQRIMADTPGAPFAYLDSEQIMLMMSGYRDMILHSENANDPLAALKWRMASKYVTDVLINKADEKGFSFATPMTGHSKGVNNFFNNLRKAGYLIDHHHCDAEEDVQMASNQIRHELYGAPLIDAETIQRKNTDVHDHMMVFAQYTDRLSVYFRVPAAGTVVTSDPRFALAKAPLLLAMSSDGREATLGDGRALIAFNRARKGTENTVENLISMQIMYAQKDHTDGVLRPRAFA